MQDLAIRVAIKTMESSLEKTPENDTVLIQWIESIIKDLKKTLSIIEGIEKEEIVFIKKDFAKEILSLLSGYLDLSELIEKAGYNDENEKTFKEEEKEIIEASMLKLNDLL